MVCASVVGVAVVVAERLGDITSLVVFLATILYSSDAWSVEKV